MWRKDWSWNFKKCGLVLDFCWIIGLWWRLGTGTWWSLCQGGKRPSREWSVESFHWMGLKNMYTTIWDSQVAQWWRICLPSRRRVQSLYWEDLLEKEMATHTSILTWEIPWAEEPGGLQFMGFQRVRNHWESKQQQTITLQYNIMQHTNIYIYIAMCSFIFESSLD